MESVNIFICDNCEHENLLAPEQREMVAVCGICYDETCPTMTKDVWLCRQCQEALVNTIG